MAFSLREGDRVKFSQLKTLSHHNHLAVSVELCIQGNLAVGRDRQIPTCPGCILVEPAYNLGFSRGKGKQLERRIALASFVGSAGEINALWSYSPVVTRLAGDKFFRPSCAGHSPNLTRLPIPAFAVINKFAI